MRLLALESGQESIKENEVSKMENILEFVEGNLNESDREKILKKVQANHFVVLRGLVKREVVREKIPLIWDYATSAKHLGTSGISKEVVRRFSSKWSIGGESPIQADIARFMLTIYSPLLDKDTFGISSFFNTLIQVRDLCAGRPEALYDDKLEPPFFNGSRLQIYPSGGGFMSAHTDSTAVNTFNAASNGVFLQPLLLVSERGVDYDTGGAFYVKDGEKVFIENGTQSGDIVVYDESIKHGVGDVDSDHPLDLQSRRGRIVALTTIYK
jgi:hypothetical protein